jgi:pimeloyl-ACP methyl ester carboxylesterase
MRGADVMPTGGAPIRTFTPLFGIRRDLTCPPLERIDFAAGDGDALCLHHTSGGDRGPVLMTPGTAMTALTYCVDTVRQNIVEFLVEQGFDVWLFDWRTSPLLDAHKRPYTFEDVARYDWPAAIAQVKKCTGKEQVSILAHCLSSPCLLLSLVRGYTKPEDIRALVASQVALHLKVTTVGTVKINTYVDKLLPNGNMMHQQPAELSGQISDRLVSMVSWVLPRTFCCDNRACYRHAATFGELILHQRINKATHALMGELVPECLTAFLKDVATWVRHGSVLTAEDMRHLDRLRLPIHFISGRENRMFVPAATEESFRLLCDANGESYYKRSVFEGFGHLDTYFGEGASNIIWPSIAHALDPGDRLAGTA